MELKRIEYNYKGYKFIISRRMFTFKNEVYETEDDVTYEINYQMNMYAQDKKGEDLVIQVLVKDGRLVELHKNVMNEMVDSMEDFIENTALSLE